jgi:hypothetical protein
VEVPFGGQPTDPLLVAGVELLKVRVEPVGHPVAFGPQLPTMGHQDPQIFQLAGGLYLCETRSERKRDIFDLWPSWARPGQQT